MKTIVKFLIIGIIFQNCQSQSNFDIADLTLKNEKVSELVSENMKKQVFPMGNTNNEYMNIRHEKFLNFNNTNLKGRQHPDSNRGINGVSFYYNKKDSIIYKYEIYIFSEKQAKDLLQALKTKLGAPQFTHYHMPEDKLNDNFNALLWEDTKGERLFLFQYSLDETVKAKLEVKRNSDDIQELNLFGNFSYWEDYLYVRQRKNDPNYTYQDFLKEQLDKNPDNFQNLLSK